MQTISFIIGAGASIGFGFPSGNKLVDDILDLLSQHRSDLHKPDTDRMFVYDNFFLDNFFTTKANRNKLMDMNAAIISSRPTSIDLFLASNLEFGEVGRGTIAYIISKYENRYRDYYRSRLAEFDWIHTDGGWVRDFFGNWQSRNATFSKDAKINLIIFNYDRCIEWLIIQMLMHFNPGTDFDQACSKFYNRFDVHHVYGSIGEYDTRKPDHFEFGTLLQTKESLRMQSDKLLLMYDRTKDTHFTKVRELVTESDAIVFSGFGYDNLNMSRLGIDSIKNPRMKLMGSAFNMGQGARKYIADKLGHIKGHSRSQISNIDSNTINLIDCDSRRLLQEIYI